MKLFEFLLPTHTNAGRSYEQARKKWEQAAVTLCGGITVMPTAHGRWRGPDGRDYNEAMVPYRVATVDALKDILLANAMEMFPDQLSIFVATLGEALIRDRHVVLPVDQEVI